MEHGAGVPSEHGSAVGAGERGEAPVQWREDVLGAGFMCTDIDLGTDDEGQVHATLVRALPAKRGMIQSALDRWLDQDPACSDVDVLYVHGWSDYFFQRSLADFWTSRGARFFALDLRKYGRNLRADQTPGFISSLEEYDAEIGKALDIIASDARGPRRLVLFGHSTGGLVLSLWAARHPGRAAAVLLNSPWLEFQLSSTARQVVTPILNVSVHLGAKEAGPQLDNGFYARAQQEVGPHEELALVRSEWRPAPSFPARGGWLRAVLAGHASVNAGLHLNIPVLVLLSERWTVPLRWSPEITRSDTVLNVDEVARAALHLGQSVTIERIPGALHDVLLSAAPVRADAFSRLDAWVAGWNAVSHLASTSRAAGQGTADSVTH